MSDELSEGEYQALTDDSTSPTWTCRDGRVIAISDMENEHLVNTLRFLVRRASTIKLGVISMMGKYIATATDGAADACQMEADQISVLNGEEVLELLVPQFTDLRNEAEFRKLEWRKL